MTLPEILKSIQRAVGCETIDGVFGPVTAARVLGELATHGGAYPVADDAGTELDARSAKNIATLDPKARDQFAQFYRLANATAATLGCTYIMIDGNRTWDAQDRLYEIGRVTGGSRVTNARGGQSNHNFGIAADFGVFQGKVYLDDLNRPLAAKVHKACSMHAAACGLEWGGSWKSIVDQPHYEISTGLSMMEKRNLYQARGSVLS